MNNYGCSEIIAYLLVGFAVGVIFGIIFTFPMMLLWNWLMPYIFGLPELNFWQMWGLLVLTRWFFPTNVNVKK